MMRGDGWGAQEWRNRSFNTADVMKNQDAIGKKKKELERR